MRCIFLTRFKVIIFIIIAKNMYPFEYLEMRRILCTLGNDQRTGSNGVVFLPSRFPRKILRNWIANWNFKCPFRICDVLPEIMIICRNRVQRGQLKMIIQVIACSVVRCRAEVLSPKMYLNGLFIKNSHNVLHFSISTMLKNLPCRYGWTCNMLHVPCNCNFFTPCLEIPFFAQLV